MSGERALLNSVFGRIAAAVLAAVVALLPLSPLAAATPESDAADVINQAYDASGGVAGPMGPSDGGVYPVGGGFGQNFAGGKILFTPDTGAHPMTGAILQKYDSLGGAADGDLGFPTIDEGPGKAPGSRNTTFSAADKPVIFWTPDTGAHVVRGAINAAWDKLGGSAGILGVPTEDEVFRGDLVSQKFTGGELTWNRSSKEFTTVPPDLAGQLAGLTVPDDATSAINAARRAAGGPLGPLGAKQGQQYSIGPDGAGQDFTGGKIFYSPATGANVVSGQVLKKYESVGGPQSDLGLPTSNEADGGLKTGSRVITFSAEDKPLIFWTPDYGAFIVRGAMNAAWDKLGGAIGPLGPPVADQTDDGNVVAQRFTGGEISWDKQSQKFSTEPANLASGLAGLTVPGYEPPDASNAAAPNSNERNWLTPSWWWLLAGIPLLLVIGLILVATLRKRRGGDDDGKDPFDSEFETEFEVDRNHDTTAEAEAVRLAGSDEYGRARLAENYGRPSGSEPSGLGEGIRDPFEQSAFDESDDDGDEFSELEPEPDDSVTAPTRIPAEADTNAGRHSSVEPDEPPADMDEPATPPPPPDPDSSDPPAAQTAFRLPLDDPYTAPVGYAIKADTKSGMYWGPESDLYDHIPADVYFINEEFARANGFVKAD
ncbi:LGFP repeat-containing protein [Mycobacterium sp. ITM-2016-00318]|uniref:LGFP repeat-containing protein n=1 Tax=Mycobacterium sp. ITM-2016-00318 TaxID=2099693 RepID=UPI000CF9FE0D|nr:LGFP repeat-containing protein [Mycobacterium sp. ITM-2016-00318]WNG94928.1 LGFP repeat-containing protein [Mycobacterium sp. ITM-2016-00318]